MSRIAFIGAGSYVFTRELVKDILSVPELTTSELVLWIFPVKILRH